MHRPRRIFVAHASDDEDNVEAFAGKLWVQSFDGLRIVDVNTLNADTAVGGSSDGEPSAA